MPFGVGFRFTITVCCFSVSVSLLGVFCTARGPHYVCEPMGGRCQVFAVLPHRVGLIQCDVGNVANDAADSHC